MIMKCVIFETIAPDLPKEGIHILVDLIQIQEQTISSTQAINTTNMTEHVSNNTDGSHELSMLYTTVTDDDAEIDHSDEDYVASSQYEPDDNNDAEEKELQTPVIPVTENTGTQWESSQWYSSDRYDYTQSRAFLDMGSGSPIHDLVESGTLRLLDCNDSMTDIQLGMRFVDKVQAISAVQKWSISVGREYRVVKSKSDQWTAKRYHHSDSNYCSCCRKWQTYTLPCSNALAVCREKGTRTDTYVPEIYLRQTYRKSNFNSRPRCGRCRMPGHNRKNCNNSGSSNV
ncbi:hypothetical protein M9H77_21140 [Catharanthus roseus]|uniref:Uncharacterized protein n=1 Tax=Catharanthus roseus TaxID=4058 RepID=A0ACC0AP84_CATRO|nr:hypothetical protein M9H77_21140 [Catharanthus roseus]